MKDLKRLICRKTLTKRFMKTASISVAVCLLVALTSGLWAQPLQGQEREETPSVRTDSPSSLSEAAQTAAIASSAVRRDNNITAGIRGDARQTGAAQGSPLWDNDLIADGVSGRAMSPPEFPDIRVVDDFVIPAGEEWVIQDFHTNIIEDATWTDGGVAEIYIYDDNNNSPGNLLISISNLPFTKMATGDEFFGRVDYDYWIENLNIPLGPGRYWIGSRFPNGGGAGNNWWMTSSGNPDGPDTSGWLSFDAGQSWTLEGNPVWDHAFTVTGIIADPCPWDLDGSGGVGTGDLLVLFAQWGTAGSADFDGSGAVGTQDLLILFANWGPCP